MNPSSTVHPRWETWAGRPPAILDDKARARESDPVTSHIAADISSRNLKQTKRAVLELIAEHGPLTGIQINQSYAEQWEAHGWGPVAWDTPRKRAGDLFEDGLLFEFGTRIAPGNHAPERVFDLTDLGRQAVAS